MEQEKKKTNVESKAMSRVLESERQSWVSIAFLWIGTMICIPMLMVGGMLSAAMTLGNIILAAFLGFLICSAIMVLTGMMATDLGLPSAMCATKAFGDRGSSLLTSLVVFIAQLGWFGVQTATCATAFNTLMAMMGVTFPFWISCLIWGVIMLVTAVYGFNMMKILNYIAVPALVAMCIFGAAKASSGVGMSGLMAMTPEAEMPMSAAISMIIGLFAVGTVINCDYARYAKSRADATKATFIGVLPAAVMMITVGAIMALATGNFDVTGFFANIGLPVVSMLVLILATWTTNTSNAYTSGLAAMKVFGFKDEKRPMVTMICGAIGTLIAIAGLADVLTNFINILSSIVPPIAGVMVADYWIIGKGKAENWYPVKGFNGVGIAAWAVGSIVALKFSFFSPALDGIIVCAIAYVVLHQFLGKTTFAGGGKMSIEEAEESVSQ